MLQDDPYKYPDVFVCLYDYYGCDAPELEKDCMFSADSTEGGLTNAIFNPGKDNEQDIVTEAKLTEVSVRLAVLDSHCNRQCYS